MADLETYYLVDEQQELTPELEEKLRKLIDDRWEAIARRSFLDIAPEPKVLDLRPRAAYSLPFKEIIS